MKKMPKILYIVFGAILILIVAVLAVDIFADHALKLGIETAATKTLNVGVSVADVDLAILAGKLGLNNLLINNPPGYQHDRLLELKDARIGVNVKSLLSDTVNIREIKLDGVNLVLEQKGITGNNLQDIIKAIPRGEPKAEAEAKKPGKKLHIDNLEITDVTVNAKLLPTPGKSDTVTLKLKPIKMTDLGSDNKLDTAELSGRILLAIATGVAEQGAGLLPDDVIGPLKSELQKITELSKTLLKESEKVFKEGEDLGKDVVERAKDVGEGIKEIGEGFKGLLKPKKQEEK